MRGPRTAMKRGPRSPQLEKALAQKRRPNTAKNKQKLKKKIKKKKDKIPKFPTFEDKCISVCWNLKAIFWVRNSEFILWHNFPWFGPISYTAGPSFSSIVGRIDNPDNPERIALAALRSLNLLFSAWIHWWIANLYATLFCTDTLQELHQNKS